MNDEQLKTACKALKNDPNFKILVNHLEREFLDTSSTRFTVPTECFNAHNFNAGKRYVIDLVIEQARLCDVQSDKLKDG